MDRIKSKLLSTAQALRSASFSAPLLTCLCSSTETTSTFSPNSLLLHLLFLCVWSFILPSYLFSSVHKHLLSACYVPASILEEGTPEVNGTGRVSYIWGKNDEKNDMNQITVDSRYVLRKRKYGTSQRVTLRVTRGWGVVWVSQDLGSKYKGLPKEGGGSLGCRRSRKVVGVGSASRGVFGGTAEVSLKEGCSLLHGPPCTRADCSLATPDTGPWQAPSIGHMGQPPISTTVPCIAPGWWPALTRAC